ncbi:S-adenosyl methyltransferase [Saccharopolyspora kobensis]|uniref:S-adenosyl methyltransferase n=1 Tax=Saccharopolyspora kobensis TaxID=146035 RepID=A0A1H6CCK6_9PSEU|nr:SAM-dependent methyltransferase [Saccharopolyspora kobensis]SEG70507.1 S-adenosyl methyltransferase [Saccharopolyspora kobensis]SFC35159.1 S-adenosyl methyltransferase [Saccharopolyspora kobensis]
MINVPVAVATSLDDAEMISVAGRTNGWRSREMQQRPDWAPEGVDLEKPSAARCYDFYLGGAYNFEVDRELGRKVMEVVPNVQEIAINNRAFLRRAVRYCLDQGVRQFLDIGSGIPTVGNVHEIAQAADPESRVVYVDNEPVAVAHSRAILGDTERATIVQADLLDVEGVLDAPETRRMLDFSRPIAVMMVALVHFVADSSNPREVIRRYYERLPAGSYLGFSHVTGDHYMEGVQGLVKLYEDSINPVTLRTREEVAELIGDFEIVEPGVVYVPDWRPDTEEDVWEQPERSIVYGAVGRKV